MKGEYFMEKLTGYGHPHNRLVGEVGQHYEDLNTGDLYECRIASEYSRIHGWPVGGYVWELRAKGEDIRELFGSGDGSQGGISVTGATVGQIIEIASVDVNGKPTSWKAVNKPSKLSELQNDLYYSETIELATLSEHDMVWNDDGTGMGYYSYQFPEPFDWLTSADTFDYRVKCIAFGSEWIKETKDSDTYVSDEAIRDNNLAIYKNGILEFYVDYCPVSSLELTILRINTKKISGDVLDFSTVTRIERIASDKTTSIMPFVKVKETSNDPRDIIINDGLNSLSLGVLPVHSINEFPGISRYQFTLPSVGNTSKYEVTLDPNSSDYSAENVSNILRDSDRNEIIVLRIGGLYIRLYRDDIFGRFKGTTIDEDMGFYGVYIKSYENYDGYTITVKRYF